MSSAEEVHLAKAWSYLQKLESPDQFALFQANYIGDVLDVKDRSTLWRLRQILDTARERAFGQGLNAARVASNARLWNLPPMADRLANLPPEASARFEKTIAQWQALDQKTRQEIREVLPPTTLAAYDASFPTVLDFDSALKSDPAQAEADPRFTDLTPEQVFEAWPKPPGSHYVRLPPKADAGREPAPTRRDVDAQSSRRPRWKSSAASRPVMQHRPE